MLERWVLDLKIEVNCCLPNWKQFCEECKNYMSVWHIVSHPCPHSDLISNHLPVLSSFQNPWTPWIPSSQAQLYLCYFFCLETSLPRYVPDSPSHILQGFLENPALAAAAAAKSLQSCLTLCDPIDGSPPGSPVPGILQARTLGWVAISFSNAWKWKVKGKSLSRVGLFAISWTAAHQTPLSVGFSGQEYWSGVPSPGYNI